MGTTKVQEEQGEPVQGTSRRDHWAAEATAEVAVVLVLVVVVAVAAAVRAMKTHFKPGWTN